MSNIVWFLIIAAILVAFIVLIIAAGKSKSEDGSENYNPPILFILKRQNLWLYVHILRLLVGVLQNKIHLIILLELVLKLWQQLLVIHNLYTQLH